MYQDYNDRWHTYVRVSHYVDKYPIGTLVLSYAQPFKTRWRQATRAGFSLTLVKHITFHCKDAFGSVAMTFGVPRGSPVPESCTASGVTRGMSGVYCEKSGY